MVKLMAMSITTKIATAIQNGCRVMRPSKLVKRWTQFIGPLQKYATRMHHQLAAGGAAGQCTASVAQQLVDRCLRARLLVDALDDHCAIETGTCGAILAGFAWHRARHDDRIGR